MLEDNSEQAKALLNSKAFEGATEIGLFLESEAKLRTPVDTGLLRSSIFYRTKKTGEGERTVVVGTGTEYAIYVEKGTKKQKAQPFLKPALFDNLSKIRAIIRGVFADVWFKRSLTC